jgi:hypothetical protein
MKKYLVFIGVLTLALGLFAQPSDQEERIPRSVILLGASVGRAWEIQLLPERTGVEDYDFEYVAGGGFDKTNALKRILSRENKKPDAIFLKECAAYFPGDFDRYKKLVMDWIGLCKQEGVIPIPATVVPVTRLHAFKKILIDIIKGRGLFKEGNPFSHSRNAAILAYNDWIKSYAAANELMVLDMEAAVIYHRNNRFLREDFAKVDGLHLNAKAYESLDELVLSTLRGLKGNTQN